MMFRPRSKGAAKPIELQRIEHTMRSQPNQAEVLKLLAEDAVLTGTMMYRQNPDGTVIRIPPLSATR